MSTIHKLFHRQAHQAARIGAGVRDGSLTKEEASKLTCQLNSTSENIVAAKTDNGRIGRKERVELRAQQVRNSADIFLARHNGQVR